MNILDSSDSFLKLNAQIEACRLCPRLATYREEIARVKKRAFRDETYWGKPVPGFGDEKASVLVVGLAPGAHGSNRTGRMFTGDASGEFLYSALYRAGFANQPSAVSRDDDLKLNHLYISAVARCAPPDNKPLPVELRNCQPYLLREMELLPDLKGIVALGKIAYDSVSAILTNKRIALPKVEFHHSAFTRADSQSFWLLGSYHPSRQNTQTGRLTVEMFDQIWDKVRRLIE